MTLTVALTPEEESKLLAEARARGVSPDALVHNAVKELLSKIESSTETAKMTPQERAGAFEEWARSHRCTPPLSDEAISRETLYGERS